MTALLAVATLLLAVTAAGAGFLWRRAHARQQQTEIQLRVAHESLESLQRSCGLFAPAEIIEDLARGAQTKSEKKDVTILFADLAGFTAMSELMDPALVVEILNGYFAHVTRAIRQNRGHVNRFMGDGLLATFGALDRNPWQNNDACHAALEMREAVRRYNETLSSAGRPPLDARIGIHRGEVVAGVLGSEHLVEYTVIGADVNLAARVESLTRKLGVAILVTDAVRRGLDARFSLREMPAMEVKGVTEPVSTFALESYSRQTAALQEDPPGVQAPA